MGIFFGAEIRQNKDQFYIKIILDLIQDFLSYQILQNVHKKTNIKTNVRVEVSSHFGLGLFWSMTKYFWIIMSKPILSRSKNNFGPMVEEWGIKNNPNRTVTISSILRHSIVIATHHKNRERSKLCTGA